MSSEETNAYILGTEQAEMHRLGFQHMVWAEEAFRAWKIAGFSQGHTILDLGCGPGFLTRDLGYIVGKGGKVIGVDISENYTGFARQVMALHGLNAEFQTVAFDDMTLSPGILDGAYCRWALAWVKNPEEIVENIFNALKPGAAFAAHEYFNWSFFQVVPHSKSIALSLKAALNGWKQMEGNINVGSQLPEMFQSIGFKRIKTRPMTKLARAGDMEWYWPKTFFKIYFPKLVSMGLLDQTTCDDALHDMDMLEQNPNAMIYTPQMIEVIGWKA